MAARFYRKESAADGFRRLIGEQTGMLVSLLADQGGVERIHEARVELKRMRALLQLAKSGLDAEVFGAENRTLRDTGRSLAQAREAEVNLVIFQALGEPLAEAERAIVGRLLEDDVARTHKRSARAARLATIAATLRACGHTLGAAHLEVDDWSLLAPALELSYRNGRKLRQVARDPKREAELHEARKRVKRLFYQLEYLRRGLAKPARKTLGRLRKLAVLLGEHHDVCVLRATLQEHAAHGITAAGSLELGKKLKAELERLRKKIRKQAKAAFEERPKAFLKGVHASWKCWRAEKPEV
jgi:CHAD domain-containing protein